MNAPSNIFVAIIFIIILIISIAFIIASANYEAGYIEGQIDYANSKVIVELRKSDSGATNWTTTQPAKSFFDSRYVVYNGK